MQSVPMHPRRVRPTLSTALALAPMLALAAPAFGVNVVDFGATPDDGRDDSAAFARAVNAAGDGGRIDVPAGAFDLTTGLDLGDGQTLAGAGRDATTLRRLGTRSAELVRVSGRAGVTVTALTLDGRSGDGTLNPAATQGVLAENSTRLTVAGVRVTNLVKGDAFGPAGVYASTRVTDSTFTGNEFTHIGAASDFGAGLRFDDHSDRNTVAGNVIRDTGRGGILFKASTDATIRDNVVTGSGMGTPDALGIEVFGGSHRAVVEGNAVDHWISVDNSHTVAVRRNTVHDADRPGYVALAGLELAGASHDAVFADNVVAGGSHIGWSVSNVGARDRVLFARNAVDDARTFGVQIQADGPANGENGEDGEAGDGANRRFMIVGNRVTNTRSDAPIFGPPGASGDGLRLNAAGGPIRDLRIEGNTIAGNAGPAFGLLGDVSALDVASLDVSGNVVRDNRDDAVPDGVPGDGPSARLTIAPAGPTDDGPADGGFTFAVEFLDAGGSALVPDAVLWDFGDGPPETGPAARSHAYARPGTYAVTVVGWDAAGRAAVASSPVASPSPPSPSPSPPPARCSSPSPPPCSPAGVGGSRGAGRGAGGSFSPITPGASGAPPRIRSETGLRPDPGRRSACPRRGVVSRSISNLKSQISNLKSQISNLKSQISNLKSQISNLKSQISNLNPDS